jgi:prepilin-type N-terminal cleavage/methylation domain-containing protein
METILMKGLTIMKTKRQPSAKGFTLMETMIALAVLAVGILGLAAMLGDSLAYMQGSQDDFIAQQKAEEAAEAIFTAKYNNPNNWAAISNNTAANPAGLFLVGPQPLLQPSPTGLVGSVDDLGVAAEYILSPGPDGMLGTADDIKYPLSSFTRTIAIANVAGNVNLRTITITVTYSAGKFRNRQYVLNTYISAFN